MKTPFLSSLLFLSLLVSGAFCYGQDVEIMPNAVDEFTNNGMAATKARYRDYDPKAPNYILMNAINEKQAQINFFKDKLAKMALVKQELVLLKQLMLKQNPNNPIPAFAHLGQNNPNPFIQETTIPYFIPESATTAQISFYSSTGQEVHSVKLLQKGQGEIIISSSQFSSGTYVYRIIIDGRGTDSKKLVLVK